MEANEEKLAHVAELIQRAKDAELLGAGWADDHGLEWLAEAYNGIGPAYLSDKLRAKLTAWLELFEPAALIDDCRKHVSDGSRLLFNFSNREFRYNCLALADAKYAWWHWKRYRARAVAELLYDCVCSDAGWKAWEDAAQKRRERETASVQQEGDQE